MKRNGTPHRLSSPAAARVHQGAATTAEQTSVPASGRRPLVPPLGETTASCPCAASLTSAAALLLESAQRLERLVASMSAAEAAGPAEVPLSQAQPVEPSHDGAEGLLTPRQLEILRLVAEGRSTDEIARQLWLSVATVRNHVARALQALGARSRIEGVARARRLGLLP
jgi:DNA-binding NarL/FixJ family response regulator